MISKNDIEESLRKKFKGTDYFLVEVTVSESNDINVFFDKPAGILIDDCKEVNRFIEGEFDREVEDYSLQVSSPGLSRPFVVKEQYEKNIGRDIKVKSKEGKFEGELTGVEDNQIKLSFLELKKGGKKKIKQQKELAISFDDIVEAKSVISFKKK